MKIILGDNQFFGVNHFDLQKGEKTKLKFENTKKIKSFIKISLNEGVDGFMINSNEKGYALINDFNFEIDKEIHFSIPYPHKYANMVNENGMLSLLKYCFKESSLIKNFIGGSKLLFSRNIKHTIPLGLNLEIPKNLRKGSYVYLQNIVTDLLIGLGRADLIVEFIKNLIKSGYKPGIITLNPVILNQILISEFENDWINELIVCFNINEKGFNVFPDLNSVEQFINSKPPYKLMGMSIFSSGAANINSSVDYVKRLDLDYIVFGSSKIENIKSNLRLFRE